MATFMCKVAQATGKMRQIKLQAKNSDALVDAAREQGYTLIRVLRRIEGSRRSSGGRIPRKIVLEFTMILKSLLSGGITIREALDVGSSMYPKSPLANIMQTMAEKIDNGGSFHESLLEFGDAFSAVFRGLVRVGEKIGSLENVFTSLLANMKREKRLREKITSALIYPMFILSAVLIGLIFLFLIVLPNAGEAFAQLGRDGSAQLTALAEKGTRSGIVLLIFTIGLLISIIAVRSYRRHNATLLLDRIALLIPFFGKLVNARQLFHFTYSMSALTGQGISVEEALEYSGDALTNHFLKNEIQLIKQRVEGGMSLYQAIKRGKGIPEYLKGWIGVGEKTASVDTVFIQLSEFYGDYLDQMTDRMTSIIEPVLIIIVGIIMIYLIFVFIIPIFGIFSTVF